MEDIILCAEPLRVTDSGNYDMKDYHVYREIALTGALLLGNSQEADLNTTIKIIDKKNKQELDRLMLKAFVNPIHPFDERIVMKGKFFNPQKYHLKVETKSTSDEINFLLYFSASLE